MYFVYVLANGKAKYFYKGLTNNLERRFEQHSNGKVSSTKNKRPLILVHVEIFESRKEAREVEKFLKSGYGREVIKEIAGELLGW